MRNSTFIFLITAFCIFLSACDEKPYTQSLYETQTNIDPASIGVVFSAQFIPSDRSFDTIYEVARSGRLGPVYVLNRYTNQAEGRHHWLTKYQYVSNNEICRDDELSISPGNMHKTKRNHRPLPERFSADFLAGNCIIGTVVENAQAKYLIAIGGRYNSIEFGQRIRDVNGRSEVFNLQTQQVEGSFGTYGDFWAFFGFETLRLGLWGGDDSQGRAADGLDEAIIIEALNEGGITQKAALDVLQSRSIAPWEYINKSKDQILLQETSPAIVEALIKNWVTEDLQESIEFEQALLSVDVTGFEDRIFNKTLLVLKANKPEKCVLTPYRNGPTFCFKWKTRLMEHLGPNYLDQFENHTGQ